MINIGILTYHRAHNYGAFLQAYALCQRLNQEEWIKAEIIDFSMKKEVDNYSLSRIGIRTKLLRPIKARFYKDIYNVFVSAQEESKVIYSSDRLISDSFEKLRSAVAGRYDVIVVGSDEVWKTDGYRGFAKPYWLPGDFGCRKIAYAVSSRSDYRIMDETEQQFLSKCVNDFEFIGVREKVTIENMKPYVADSNKLHLCCDPTFLYDFDLNDSDESLYEKYGLNKKKKNIVVMSHNSKLNKYLVLELKNKYNLISVFEYKIGMINVSQLTPFEWISIIKNADFVITTYYHTTCFCTKYGVPFITFGSAEKSSKLEELFSNDGELKNRYISDPEEFIHKGCIFDAIEMGKDRFDKSSFVNECKKSFISDFLSIIRGDDL